MLTTLSLPDAIDRLADSLNAEGMHRSADLWRDLADDFRSDGIRTLAPPPYVGGTRLPFIWGGLAGLLLAAAVLAWGTVAGAL